MVPCLQAKNTRSSVLPRPKKTTMDPNTLSSFRPIFNLSFLSKLVECVALFAENNGLFPVCQSSYRERHSTETAVLGVHNDLVHTIDADHRSYASLLVLSAAFITVDHDHSAFNTCNEQCFGVCDTSMSWCRSYLSDRPHPSASTDAYCLQHDLSQG